MEPLFTDGQWLFIRICVLAGSLCCIAWAVALLWPPDSGDE